MNWDLDYKDIVKQLHDEGYRKNLVNDGSNINDYIDNHTSYSEIEKSDRQYIHDHYNDILDQIKSQERYEQKQAEYERELAKEQEEREREQREREEREYLEWKDKVKIYEKAETNYKELYEQYFDYKYYCVSEIMEDARKNLSPFFCYNKTYYETIDYFDKEIQSSTFIDFYQHVTGAKWKYHYIPEYMKPSYEFALNDWEIPEEYLKLDAFKPQWATPEERKKLYAHYLTFFLDGSYEQHLKNIEDNENLKSQYAKESKILEQVSDGNNACSALFGNAYASIHNKLIHNYHSEDFPNLLNKSYWYFGVSLFVILYTGFFVYSMSTDFNSAFDYFIFLGLYLLCLYISCHIYIGSVLDRDQDEYNTEDIDLPDVYKQIQAADITFTKNPYTVLDYASNPSVEKNTSAIIESFKDITYKNLNSYAEYLKKYYPKFRRKVAWLEKKHLFVGILAICVHVLSFSAITLIIYFVLFSLAK